MHARVQKLSARRPNRGIESGGLTLDTTRRGQQSRRLTLNSSARRRDSASPQRSFPRKQRFDKRVSSEISSGDLSRYYNLSV
jgi:hypothetical protein